MCVEKCNTMMPKQLMHTLTCDMTSRLDGLVTPLARAAGQASDRYTTIPMEMVGYPP